MKKYYTPDPTTGEGGDKPAAPAAPENYTPLTVQNRQDWNAFLDFLDKKGVAGSTDLDKRDQSLGLSYLKQYQKLNPKTTINSNIIPSIQYEQYMLRKGDSFPTVSPEQLKYIRQGLTRPDGTSPYLSKPVSPVDGWLGSLTSRLYYPSAAGGSNTGEHYDYGLNFEDYAKSAVDPSIKQKYLVKQNN